MAHFPHPIFPPALLQEVLDILVAAIGTEWQVTLHGDRIELRPTAADLPPLTFHPERWQGGRSRHPRGVLWILTKSAIELRRELRARRESFVDVDRRYVRLRAPGLLLEERLPKERRPERNPTVARSPFSDRASFVTRTLLDQWRQEWSLGELAACAKVSLGLASRVVRYLAEEGLIATTREGRNMTIRVDSPWKLFQRWAASYRWTSNRRVTFAAPISDPESSLPRIGKELARGLAARQWAFTGPVAAHLIAPHARWDHFHVYVHAEDRRALTSIGASLGWPVSAQGRVTLMRPHYKTAVWWRSAPAEGWPTVHPLQVMADLWHYPVRGTESATEIARVLGWPPL